MKSIPGLLFLFIFISCNPAPQVSQGSVGNKNINQNAPYTWGNQTFPKSVSISSNFTADEITEITASSNIWKTVVSDQKTFFQYAAPTAAPYNLVQPDGIMGIYKSTSWPGDIDSDALAITQLFGVRQHVGAYNEYVSIEHVDIIVNYQHHTFYTTSDPTGDYDLQTVMVHEMGHFLGLQHVPDYWERPESDLALSIPAYKATSVMYPHIGGGEEKRVPQTKDINVLVNKYNITGTGYGIAAAANIYQPYGDPGQPVRILIELKASGECIHREDGAVVQRHHVKVK